MFGLAHHVHLQARHVAERDCAPHPDGGQRQPWVAGGQGQDEQHRGEQRKDDCQRADRAAFVRQLAAPDIPGGYRDAIHQQYQAHSAGAEACDVLEDGGQEGKRDKRTAVADGGHGVHQQQARLLEHLQLLQQGCGLAVGDGVRHVDQTADKGEHTQRRDGEEGFPPAEVLADKGAQRHPGDQRDGQAGKHDRNRTGGFFLRHQAGGDG